MVAKRLVEMELRKHQQTYQEHTQPVYCVVSLRLASTRRGVQRALHPRMANQEAVSSREEGQS